MKKKAVKQILTAFYIFFEITLLGFDQSFADAFQVLLLAFDAEAQDDDGNGYEDQGEHVEDTAETEVPGQQGSDHHGRSQSGRSRQPSRFPRLG